ncbi:MAG: twin-arginine translocation signal domain-containing protein [Kiritimatiellae bacterium]|nr:twin-arginine translocation signal domain-containing protein [Kiritimatiellia bacterium]
MKTRREFLATSALAAACAGCGTFGVGATRGKIVLPDALKSWKEGDLKGSDVRLYHNAHAKG